MSTTDIKKRAVRETFVFDLVDADDEVILGDDGKPCQCEVYGPGSKRYAEATARKQAASIQRAWRGKAPVLSAAESQRVNAEFLADITARIDLEYEGKTGREKLLAIFGDLEIGFIAEQVARKASDWANFSKGSATS